MESQPTLDGIMAKINNLLQIINSSNENSKSSIPCVIPTVNEVKERSENNKSKNTEKDFSKISPAIICYKCQEFMGMLLSTIQAHLTFPSMTEFSLKHLSLIALFFSESHS